MARKRKNSDTTKKTKAWISLDIDDGKGVQKFHATLIGDREDMGHFDHAGKTYWVSLPWPHSRWEENPPWKIHSVEKSYRAQRATSRRKSDLTADDKKLIDDTVLRALEDWGKRGVSVAILTEDVFENRGVDSNLDGYLPKRARVNTIMSALKRLKKSGKVSMFYGPGEKKEEVPYWERA